MLCSRNHVLRPAEREARVVQPPPAITDAQEHLRHPASARNSSGRRVVAVPMIRTEEPAGIGGGVPPETEASTRSEDAEAVAAQARQIGHQEVGRDLLKRNAVG